MHALATGVALTMAFSAMPIVAAQETTSESTTAATPTGVTAGEAVPGVLNQPAQSGPEDGLSRVFAPRYPTAMGRAGGTVRISPEWADGVAPASAHFEIAPNRAPGLEDWKISIDAVTGELFVQAPASISGATLTVPVYVNYSDGTAEYTDAKVQYPLVASPDTDADRYQPTYQSVKSLGGRAVVARINATGLPKGTTFSISGAIEGPVTAVADSALGNITFIPRADARHRDLARVPVQVTYPDGSVDLLYAEVLILAPKGTSTTAPSSTFASPTTTAPTTGATSTGATASDGVSSTVAPSTPSAPSTSTTSSTSTATAATVSPAESSTTHSVAPTRSTTTAPARPSSHDDDVDEPKNTPAAIIELPTDTTQTAPPHTPVVPARPAPGQSQPSNQADEPTIAVVPTPRRVQPQTAPAPARGAVATDLGQALDRLGLERRVDPLTGAVTIAPQTSDTRGGAAQTDGTKPPQAGTPMPKDVVLVNFSTMLSLISTGLPFIIEMIRQGRIAVPAT